jgi:hypothetical protein
MKIIIFIIMLIIIFIILCNINKNINDNFINYQMSKMGENTKDIKIHGRNINIETNNNTLNVNKLCIDDTCLNMINENTLPREQGPQGVCTDSDCYYCTCNNGLPADIGTGPNSCKKRKSDTDTQQCKSCELGYQLNSEKKCVLCTSNTYNDIAFNTSSCKTCASCPSGQYRKDCGGTSGGTCQGCQGCPAGKRRIYCGGKNPGTCAQNVCKCTRNDITVGNAASGAACTSNGGNLCGTCYDGYFGGVGQYKSDKGRLCWPCPSCPPGEYRKDCGQNFFGRCVACPGCPAGEHRIDCGGRNPGTCAQNICKCTVDGKTVGNAASGANCTTNEGNICDTCNSGYYKQENECKACAACGDQSSVGRVYRSDGKYASYHGPSAIPASFFVRDGCYGTNPGSCKLKDNVTFLCGTNVKCNQVGFSMCANSDGSGKWAKDWHWGTGYHLSYGNRQIFTSHVCGRWPTQYQIDNPRRDDGSKNANVLVYDTTYKL